MSCTYEKNSIKPCETCPKRITALHMCNLLQETKKELENE